MAHQYLGEGQKKIFFDLPGWMLKASHHSTTKKVQFLEFRTWSAGRLANAKKKWAKPSSFFFDKYNVPQCVANSTIKNGQKI